MSTKTFNKLSNKVANEYEKKGMNPKQAQKVGDATAAKVKMEKMGKKSK